MIRRLALLALFGLAVGCGRPSARLERARDLALSGHYQSSLLEARALLLTLRDERGNDEVRRGALKLAGDLCAVYLSDATCAAREYRELVKAYPLAPESFEARARLGDLDLRSGHARAAIEAWRDQVATAPDSPGADEALLKVSRALLDLGELHDARAAAAELQSRWPRSPLAPSAALLAASTYHLSGRHQDAIGAYEEVARKYRGTAKAADALFEKGNCLAEVGDDQGAVRAYSDALVRHDAPDIVQFALERAERRLQRGQAVNPRNLAAVWDRGLAATHPSRARE